MRLASIIFFFSFFEVCISQTVDSFKTTDNEILYFSRYGTGPKVVLLYGGPGYSVNTMKFWADSLSEKFECILFDQRDTGLSKNVILDSTTINLNRALKDIEELRIYLNEEKVNLCGISWGAMLTQAYAANYPEKTKKIVLVSTLGTDLSLMRSFVDNMNMRRFPVERDSLKFWMAAPDNKESKMKRKFYSYLPEFYDHKIGREMLIIFFETTTYNKEVNRLMWEDLHSSYDLKSKLQDYNGESIIIRPRQDPVPAEAVYQIKKLLPQTQIYTIEKCGHFPDYEKPKEFFKILRSNL